MKYLATRSNRFVIALLLISTFTIGAFGQTAVKKTKSVETPSATNASVDVVVFDGANIKCSDLNALHQNGAGDIRFSHILTDNELKLNFGDPNGTFPFTTGDGRIVVGPESADKTVTVTSSSNPGIVHSWSSQIQITAVVVKVGNTSYVYPYKPFKMSDTDLITGDPRGISHLTFCFGDPTTPTADDASINGRVIDASGMGIAKAQIVLVNGATGETKITMTSPFGYYRFEGLDNNELYVLNVSHKRYNFTEQQRVVMVGDSMADVDFMASPY